MTDGNKGQVLSTAIAARLDALEGELTRGWHGLWVEGDGLVFARTLRGVTETHAVDAAIIRSAEARRLDEMSATLKGIFNQPAKLVVKDREIPVSGPVQLADAVMELGRKGIGIQRYKGLGEMNPGQLWETTLDPQVRSLLQVKLSQADDAEQVFSTLMGDVVEPRREFIQSNALKVANLDV